MKKRRIIERFIRRIRNISEALTPDQMTQISKTLQGLNLDPESLSKINTSLGIPQTPPAPGSQQTPPNPMGNTGGTTVAGKGLTPGSTALGTGATPGASAKPASPTMQASQGGSTTLGVGATAGATTMGTGATPGASSKIKPMGTQNQQQAAQESLDRILYLSNIRKKANRNLL